MSHCFVLMEHAGSHSPLRACLLLSCILNVTCLSPISSSQLSQLGGIVDLGATRVKFASRCRRHDEPVIHTPMWTKDFVKAHNLTNNQSSLGKALVEQFLQTSECARVTKFVACVAGTMDTNTDVALDLSPLGALESMTNRLNIDLREQMKNAFRECGGNRGDMKINVINDAGCLGLGILQPLRM